MLYLIPCAQTICAQGISIKGTVVNSTGEALPPGVSIVEKGITNGPVTDVNGQFSLTVDSETKRLVFSFIGMLPQTIEINGRT